MVIAPFQPFLDRRSCHLVLIHAQLRCSDMPFVACSAAIAHCYVMQSHLVTWSRRFAALRCASKQHTVHPQTLVKEGLRTPACPFRLYSTSPQLEENRTAQGLCFPKTYSPVPVNSSEASGAVPPFESGALGFVKGDLALRIHPVTADRCCLQVRPVE